MDECKPDDRGAFEADQRPLGDLISATNQARLYATASRPAMAPRASSSSVHDCWRDLRNSRRNMLSFSGRQLLFPRIRNQMQIFYPSECFQRWGPNRQTNRADPYNCRMGARGGRNAATKTPVSGNPPLEVRLATEVTRLREQARAMPHGAQRSDILRKARASADRRSHQRLVEDAGPTGADMTMRRYRAYMIREDGQITNVRAFVCDSDADATVWAKQLAPHEDVELWQLDRFVTRLNSTGKATEVTHKIIDRRVVPRS